MTRSISAALLVVLALLAWTSRASAQPKPAVTFLEIGSVGCVPCAKMQPVMKSIEARYGAQVKVIFHDVRKDKAITAKYKVTLIPTQVFLDADGKEIHRHVGYYPESEIDAFLKKRGLQPKS